MANVFADFSEDALNHVSEENFFASLTCLSVLPDVEVYQGADMIRVVSPGIPNWLTNAVCRCRLAAEDVDAVLDETHEYFRSRGVVPYWQLCLTDLPADLAQRLANNGLVPQADRTAMTVDLEKLNEDIGTPDGFQIERMTDAATMKEKHGWIRRLGTGRSLGTLLIDLFYAYGFGSDSDWQHYIGLLNGKPVSWASVFYATEAAGVYAVGTLPEARRQGIGAAITLQGLLDARERGYRIGVLQSSQMGYNVYRRLGFEPRFIIKTFAPTEPPK